MWTIKQNMLLKTMTLNNDFKKNKDKPNILENYSHKSFFNISIC